MRNYRKSALWAVLAAAAACALLAGCAATAAGTDTQPLSQTSGSAVPAGDAAGEEAAASVPPAEQGDPEDGVSVTAPAGSVSMHAFAAPADANASRMPSREQIAGAVIHRNHGLYGEGELDTASYAVLAEERPDDRTLTLYLMARYAAFDRDGKSFAEAGGSSIPAALTFRAADAAGPYELAEYWEPADGGDYWAGLRRKFPASVADEDLDTQKYVAALTRDCYAQAVEHWDIDTDAIVAELLDAVAEGPAASSAPGDYAAAHPWEMRQLSCFGDYTLRYVFAQFLAGGQDGLRGRLMRIAMDSVIGGEALAGPDSQAETGQEYFDRWLSAAEADESAHGPDWMAEHRPAGALALSMKRAG